MIHYAEYRKDLRGTQTMCGAVGVHPSQIPSELLPHVESDLCPECALLAAIHPTRVIYMNAHGPLASNVGMKSAEYVLIYEEAFELTPPKLNPA